MDNLFQLDEFYLDLQEDGLKISLLSKDKIADCPFPGLRPYKTSEFQLFYGRSGQANQLLKRLRRNHFLAVIGSSGTGKSSIVRAGLLPQLYGGYLSNSNDLWNVAVCRPGNQPIKNLAIALSCTKCRNTKSKKIIEKEFEIIEPILRENSYGIIEVEKLINVEVNEKQKTNLLVIVDQFEEIFRFKREGSGPETIETSTHFTNLLLKASAQTNGSVYIIITMRSEFLGECVQFRDLPEAINQGQYLVPRLNRAELKEVITGPIRLTNNNISPILVNRLIDEIGDNMDQLPILQHALMRTYEHWKKSGASDEINYEHYEAVGKMENALGNHANEKYNELGDHNIENNKTLSKKQLITKIIFQCLTDKSTDDRGIRRPTELNNIYIIAGEIGASKGEVDEVINHFRGSETSFLMPPINTNLFPELYIDIAHESLMRNWKQLDKEWIPEEVKNARLYRRLDERRELKDIIKGGLLEDLLAWKEEYPVNSTWAARYHKTKKTDTDSPEELFRKNIAFLEASKVESEKIKKENEEKKRKEIVEQQREKRRKGVLISISIVCLVLLGLGIWLYIERDYAQTQTEIAKKALYENDLKDFPWFIDLSDTLKTYALDTLWYLKNKDSLGELNVKYSFEMAVEGQNQQRHDMSVALYLAKEAKTKDNNKITRALLDSLIKGKIIYEQKIKMKLNDPVEQGVKLLGENNKNEIIIGMTSAIYPAQLNDSTSSIQLVQYSADRKTVAISDSGLYLMYHYPLENKVLIVESRNNEPIRQIPLRPNMEYNRYVELKSDLDQKVSSPGSNSNADNSHNNDTIPKLKTNYYTTSIIIDTAEYNLDKRVNMKRNDLLTNAKQFVGTFYSDKRFFLVSNGSENEITVWGIDGNNIMTLIGHTSPVKKISCTKNRILTISKEGKAIAWDIDLEKIEEYKPDWWNYHKAIKKLDTFNEAIANEKIDVAAFSPSGQSAATCFGSKMKIRDVSGKVDTTLNYFKLPVTEVKYSPNGNYLLTIENNDLSTNPNTKYDGNVKIWETKGFKLINTFTWHTSRINDASFSADSKWIVSGSKDEVFRWSITDTTELLEEDLVLGSKFINADDVFNYFLEKGKRNKSNEEFEEAFAVLDSLSLPDYIPFLIKSLNILGQTSEGYDSSNVAINCYKKLLEFRPNDYMALNMFGLIYNQRIEYQRAIDSCNRAIKIDPTRAPAYAHRGFAHLKLNRLDSAFQDLEESKRISPRYEKVYFYLACYYATKNDPEQALKNLETAYIYGFKDPNWIKWIEEEESLNSIRSNEDYIALIKKMKDNLK